MIIRGDLLDPDVLAESARRNFDVYGFYGISVFAETAERSWADLATSRFASLPWLVLFTAGDLEAANLELAPGPAIERTNGVRVLAGDVGQCPMPMSSMVEDTDPFCGMAVEPAGNPDATLDGHTWWFCSTHCRDEFTADPAKFTGRQDVPADARGQGQPGTFSPGRTPSGQPTIDVTPTPGE